MSREGERSERDFGRRLFQFHRLQRLPDELLTTFLPVKHKLLPAQGNFHGCRFSLFHVPRPQGAQEHVVFAGRHRLLQLLRNRALRRVLVNRRVAGAAGRAVITARGNTGIPAVEFFVIPGKPLQALAIFGFYIDACWVVFSAKLCQKEQESFKQHGFIIPVVWKVGGE